jgi:chromosome segregation ATPase
VLAKIAEAKARLEALIFSEPKYAELQARTRGLENAEREHSSKLQELQGQIRGKYPIQPDHQIKGAVATLLTVKPEYEQYTLGLEVIGGTRLGQYVIDTNDNAVRWLKSSSRKVTFLPLNKVEAKVLKITHIKLAAEIAHSMGGEAIPALDAISFDESVRPVMELVFGTFFLCSSREIAEKVCFNPSIRMKTMAINGDSCDPNGNLSGGSFPNNRFFKPLRASKELADLKAALKHSHDNLAKASGDFEMTMLYEYLRALLWYRVYSNQSLTPFPTRSLASKPFRMKTWAIERKGVLFFHGKMKRNVWCGEVVTNVQLQRANCRRTVA